VAPPLESALDLGGRTRRSRMYRGAGQGGRRAARPTRRSGRPSRRPCSPGPESVARSPPQAVRPRPGRGNTSRSGVSLGRRTPLAGLATSRPPSTPAANTSDRTWKASRARAALIPPASSAASHSLTASQAFRTSGLVGCRGRGAWRPPRGQSAHRAGATSATPAAWRAGVGGVLGCSASQARWPGADAGGQHGFVGEIGQRMSISCRLPSKTARSQVPDLGGPGWGSWGS
jgi:hypothetical protein